MVPERYVKLSGAERPKEEADNSIIKSLLRELIYEVSLGQWQGDVDTLCPV